MIRILRFLEIQKILFDTKWDDQIRKKMTEALKDSFLQSPSTENYILNIV